MGDLAIAAVTRIIKNATGMRVGRDAGEFLAEYLEEIASEIATEAGKYAKHAGRKTIKANDIKLATRG